MSAIKDSYYLLFYTIFRFGVGGTSREYKKWGALLGVGVIQIFLLEIGDLWLEMATGVSHFLGLPKYVGATVVVCVFYVNYLALLAGNQWETYEKKFNQYPSRRRSLRIALAFLFIAFVVAMLFYSFHRFGVWKGRA